MSHFSEVAFHFTLYDDILRLLEQNNLLSQKAPVKFVTLYHYTDKSGAEAILQSGYVKPSEDGEKDAKFGPGVYLTALRPQENHMIKVAANNYDETWRESVNKTTSALEFRIPESRVKQMKSDRDIWLYTEGDLLLERYATHNLFVGRVDGGYDQWQLVP